MRKQVHLTKHQPICVRHPYQGTQRSSGGISLEIVYTGDGAIDNDIVDVFQDFKEEAIRKAITITF